MDYSMAIFNTLIQILTTLFQSKKSTQKTAPKSEQKTIQKTEEETMFKFSSQSLEKLKTCHPDIQKVMTEVIKHVDCTIIEGVRTKEQQEEYVRTGKSKTMDSKHLPQPDGYSHAVDVMACPIKWEDWKRNSYFAGFVMATAKSMGIDLRSGIDWDSDFDISEHSFLDAPHFELKK